MGARRDDVAVYTEHAQPAVDGSQVIRRKEEPRNLPGGKPAQASQLPEESAIPFGQLHGRTVSVAPQRAQRTSSGQEPQAGQYRNRCP